MINNRTLAPTKEEIEELQQFYNEGNSLRKTQAKFGRCRATLIRYLTTRSPKNISEEERKKRNVNKVVRWRQRAKQKLVEYKGGKCQVCGYNKYIGNLAFHHKNPAEKDFTITGKSWALNKLLKEVDKCELLCHNCHGEIHAGLVTI